MAFSQETEWLSQALDHVRRASSLAQLQKGFPQTSALRESRKVMCAEAPLEMIISGNPRGLSPTQRIQQSRNAESGQKSFPGKSIPIEYQLLNGQP